VRFEWDLRKAEANARAHGVVFVTLGVSDLGNLLVVVYAYREPDVIRVISAWKANKRQRILHEEDHR
jgi:uncharacterized DUF497 family protein